MAPRLARPQVRGGYLLPTTYYLLPTTYYLLLTTYGLLRTTCYRSARIVEIVSLYQTIAELAGLPPPAERLQGTSFASAFGAEAGAGQAGLAAAAAAAAAAVAVAAAAGGTMAGRTAAGAGAGRAEVEVEVDAEQFAFSQFAKKNETASELPGRPLVPLGSAWSKRGRTSWRQRSSQPPSQAT